MTEPLAKRYSMTDLLRIMEGLNALLDRADTLEAAVVPVDSSDQRRLVLALLDGRARPALLVDERERVLAASVDALELMSSQPRDAWMARVERQTLGENLTLWEITPGEGG